MSAVHQARGEYYDKSGCNDRYRELASFADFFFDGLITDWIVQSRIEDSLGRSKQARDIVARALRGLEELRTRTQTHLGEVQETRARPIERT